MALPAFLMLAFLLSQVFYYLKKKLSFLQNSIVFMVTVIETRNAFSILTMQLKMIKQSEELFLFLAFLAQREITIPLLVLIFINICLRVRSKMIRMMLFIGALSALTGIDFLSVHFRMVTYPDWNYFYSALLDALYLVIGLGLAQLLLVLGRWEHLKT